MKQYFSMAEHLAAPGRWFLGAPVDPDGKEVDPRQFIKGTVVNFEGKLSVPVLRQGNPLDFTFAAFNVPVVTEEVAELLSSVAPGEVQRIPIEVQGQAERYEILNVTNALPCLDEERSKIMWWTEEDGCPSKVGQYRMVTNVKLKTEGLADRQIFRIAGWPVKLVVSALVRDALLAKRVTGMGLFAYRQ